MECVHSYQYLGTHINRDECLDKEISDRVNEANGVLYQISNTRIGKEEVSRDTDSL